MEKILKPDRKYFVVSFWDHLTACISLILLAGIIHLIVHLAGGDPFAMKIVWIITLSLVLTIWIIIFPLVQWWIRKLSYIICEDRIIIHKGITTRTQQNIPYRAITDFALTRDLYERIIGIGSIKIQTAGQSHNPSGYEGSLSGLLDYDNLLTELKEKIKVFHPDSDTLTISASKDKNEHDVLVQILTEIKEIRKAIEK